MAEWTVGYTNDKGNNRGPLSSMGWAVLRDGVVWDWPLSTEERAVAQRKFREEGEGDVNFILSSRPEVEDPERAAEPPEDTYPVLRRWGPRFLVEWLFDQDRIWITAKGEQKFISQMEPSHLLNTLLFLERVEDDLDESGVTKGTLQHTALYQAIKRRLLVLLYD